MNVTHCTSIARRLLPGLLLALAAGTANAEKLTMPKGMGGVPDIGAIPCSVVNEMIVVAPLGTRHSLLTWSAGYLKALSGQSLQDLVNAPAVAGASWTYAKLGDALLAYCAANPKNQTSDAAADLAQKLGARPAATP